MKLRVACAGVVLAAVASLLCACRWGPEARRASREAPRPRLDLAGQSYARRVDDGHPLPRGPGAEGRPGDLLLENAFVRFVVSAPDRFVAGLPGGNLIDAAIQDGEDRMRLLVPLLGREPRTSPVYGAARVEHPGGPDLPAVVVVEGYVAAHPSVKVTTSYTLRPGSSSLEISTTVRNEGQGTLSRFACGDVLYHGRTLRYVPGCGSRPTGRTSSSTWMSFFWEDRAWGLLCGLGGSMDGLHRVGASELLYGTVDLPPGQSRAFRRRLVAVPGGPERVWEIAYPEPDHVLSHLAFQLTDRDSGEPLAGGELIVQPADGRAPALLVTDGAGRAELDLRAGSYAVTPWAVGRPPVQSLTVTCSAGKRHRLTIPLPPRAVARVNVRAKIGEFFSPTTARLSSYRAPDLAEPCPPVPAFPTGELSGVALADGATAMSLPLPPFGFDIPSSFFVVASKGPLFDCSVAPVTAAVGETLPVELVLRRLVDPGDYVAVDFRQHSDASADCALTLRERALADACEGLDAAVVSDPVVRSVFAQPLPQSDCVLMPGFRLALDGLGSFSLYPIDAASALLTTAGTGEADVEALFRPGRSAAQVLAQLREVFPGAIIQVDSPLDGRRGYFALSGYDPPRRRFTPAAFSPDFDAVELLTGRNVAAARRLLPYWFHLLNAGRKVIVTGGSGSRAISGPEAGVARTFVHCPRQAAIPSAAEISAAVRRLKEAPNAFVTNGPFIEATVNGQPIGSFQTAREGMVRMRLRVRAPAWVDVRKVTVYRNGERVEEFDLADSRRLLRCDRDLELDASSDCWFVVQVEGRKPMGLA